MTITPIAQLPSPPAAASPTTVAVLPTGPVSTTPKPTSTPGRTKRPPSQTPTSQPTAATEPTIPVDPNDPACFDPAYTLEGFAWTKPVAWFFNRDSVPPSIDADAALAVIKQAFDNVTTEANDCGRPDTITAQATYMGETELTPCADTGDGVNVVGFGNASADLSADTIAYTCPYTFKGTGDVAEADIVISDELDWAMSLDTCLDSELLEPTVTHEVGHVFGLAHVGEKQHGDLTMSTRSNGPCDNEESTLGLGDMLGLEHLYGAGASPNP